MESRKIRMKRIIKKAVTNCILLKKENIFLKIKEADVVSFDIFDTLVKRDVPIPVFVHVIVGQKFAKIKCYEIENYMQRRIQAEVNARRVANGKEITLIEIYQHLSGVSDNDKLVLQRLEVETEYEVCCPNQRLKQIYEKALNEEKRIIITSDMYLPEETILKILDKCGYIGYEKLFLSASYGKTKSSGQLFDEVLSHYKNTKILHVGDNVKSDYYRAKQRRIDAILIENESDNLEFYKKNDMKSQEEQMFYAFMNNHKPIDKNDFINNIGYEILGPMLWGFSHWLHEELESMHIEKVFFLSREGALLQRAYQTLFPNSNVKQTYLYVSRQALQVPLLLKCNNFYDILQVIKPLMHSHTIENVGRSCGFGDIYREECQSLKLKLEDNVFEIPESKQEDYYNLIQTLGKRYFEEQDNLIREYLQQVKFNGKVAVVDIGWQGTMQKTLMEYIENDDVDIYGFYLGVRNTQSDDCYRGLRRKGYLFEPDKNEEWNLMLRFTNEVLETLFLNRVGSLEKYAKADNGIKPVLGKNEQKENVGRMLEQMQEVAVQFLVDLMQQKTEAKKAVTRENIMKGYSAFAVRPSLKIIHDFEDFYFLDAGITKMLPEHTSIYYLFQPWKLIKEMQGSTCKIFFMKSVYKIPFPYFDTLRFLLYRLNFKSQNRKNMEK